MSERLAHLTEAQRLAIQTIDRSVLVSAAAGSGKTTVLAERCAALVCDLPPNQRCRIDELLVVTFTEAAAAEMKTRIGAAIRQRLKASPNDGHLQQQMYLIETAGISTIHAFCRSLIQRWFPQAQVDPQASVLSGDEAQLLKDEVLEAFFVELYAGQTPLGLAFQSLIDDYSAGDERLMARVILQLHEFISSLPDPERWLADAVKQLDPACPHSLLGMLHDTQHLRICGELKLQVAYCRRASQMIRQCWPIATMHAEAIDEHAGCLQLWLDVLVKAGAQNWDTVAADICAFEFDRAKSRPRDLSDEDKAAFDCAKDLRDKTKDLFKSRLQEACCTFSAQEYADGLQRIAPHVQTLTQLAAEFDSRYRRAKNDQSAIDFNDLQRYAHRLLLEEGTSHPSAIARQLQQQYRYVLVDEFQDVDPLQEAIIRCVSRESADPPNGNLFTVGDIKQSIYRFRLAEPTLFTGRADAFNTRPDQGSLIHLQENFRSRPALIDAINILFRALMSADFGGSDYDDTAELHAGLKAASVEHSFDLPAVDIHLLEPVVESTRDADNDDEIETTDELEGIEREAYLIGRLIQNWMGDNPQQQKRHIAAKSEMPSQPPTARPLEYSDIVILLRSLPHKAGPIADILRRMGLPVRLDRDQMGMDSTEVRDVIALLQVLDNGQQDIPLAAVLRSPLLGRPFDENELLEIRFFNRVTPFYEAVHEYAERGPEESLKHDLALVLQIIERYRRMIQRTPVAEVLWEIFEEHDYLSCVAGLPDGARRREHLLSLHELSRQFAGFTRQGLQRFLRFVEEMAERDQSAPAASATNENVVRIMTIHTSKGLEFPVVILADLQKSFNLTDVRTPVLLDRKLGIAMRGADAEKRIFYPTLISQLAAESGRHESLSEELRVLYVALTRAREHLVLIGRAKLAYVYAQRAAQKSVSGQNSGGGLTLPRLELEIANNYLDWLLPALGAAPCETVQWPDQNKSSALFKISTHDRSSTDRWRIPPAVESAQIGTLTAVAKLQPLASDESFALPSAIEPHLQTLNWMYPATELTTVPARISVTELKRRWQTDIDPDERVTPSRRAVQAAPPAFMLEQGHLTPTRRGSATHRFLQLIDISRACDAADLAAQLRELVERGRIAANDVDGIAVDACTWFLRSELGQRIRRYSGRLLREVPFISRLQPSHYDALVQARDHRDVLLLRGMIDVLLRPDSGGIELIDYKTDQIAPDACERRAEDYRTQIDHYTAAIEGIYRQNVSHRWLVFLRAQCMIDLAQH